MKYRTEIVREGELLGSVDWDYNFLQHFSGYCCSDEEKKKRCERCIELFRKVEADPEAVSVETSYSGVFRDVYAVGMYDGWPFWKPTPALLCSGVLGPEWHFFYELQGIRPKASQPA